MLAERFFQGPSHSVRFAFFRQRDLRADCTTQVGIILTDISVIRVTKACSNLMDRGRPVRFERLFQYVLQPGGIADPDCSRLPPPMTQAGFPISGGDLMAEFSVGLIEPLGIFVAQTSRHLRQAAGYASFRAARSACWISLAVRDGDTSRAPVSATASFAAAICTEVGPKESNRLAAGIFKYRQVRSRFSSRGTVAPRSQFWRMLPGHRICCARARTFPCVTWSR
jgi:hypothetical protein